MLSKRVHILIVDDSMLILQTAQAALETAGFHVELSNDLRGLEPGQLAGLDLILMDVEMPELFGDDIASLIRNKRGVMVPIYLYSTLDEDELSKRAAEANIDGYICKRHGVEAMVVQVKSILQVAGAEQS